MLRKRREVKLVKGEKRSVEWVLPQQLARSSRPGFPDKGVGPELVDDWLRQAADLGIKSIICLLHETQLAWYPDIPEGLLERYRLSGLEVAHFNILDYKTPPIGPEGLPPIWDAYQQLPKPVLIHCSLGQDRTGQAVDFILEQLSQSGPSSSAPPFLPGSLGTDGSAS